MAEAFGGFAAVTLLDELADLEVGLPEAITRRLVPGTVATALAVTEIQAQLTPQARARHCDPTTTPGRDPGRPLPRPPGDDGRAAGGRGRGPPAAGAGLPSLLIYLGIGLLIGEAGLGMGSTTPS